MWTCQRTCQRSPQVDSKIAWVKIAWWNSWGVSRGFCPTDFPQMKWGGGRGFCPTHFPQMKFVGGVPRVLPYAFSSNDIRGGRGEGFAPSMFFKCNSRMLKYMILLLGTIGENRTIWKTVIQVLKRFSFLRLSPGGSRSVSPLQALKIWESSKKKGGLANHLAGLVFTSFLK